ncbi:MAG: hypothetical protein FWG66_13870 [Spirochaetes bacterium]|nr:hypothetical protein [Spirochaetota bacterium]
MTSAFKYVKLERDVINWLVHDSGLQLFEEGLVVANWKEELLRFVMLSFMFKVSDTSIPLEIKNWLDGAASYEFRSEWRSSDSLNVWEPGQTIRLFFSMNSCGNFTYNFKIEFANLVRKGICNYPVKILAVNNQSMEKNVFKFHPNPSGYKNLEEAIKYIKAVLQDKAILDEKIRMEKLLVHDVTYSETMRETLSKILYEAFYNEIPSECRIESYEASMRTIGYIQR